MRIVTVIVLILAFFAAACNSANGEDVGTEVPAITPTPTFENTQSADDGQAPSTPQEDVTPLSIGTPTLEDLYWGHEFGDFLYDGTDFGIQFFTEESVTVRIYDPEKRSEVETSVAAFFADFGVTDLSTIPILWCEATGGTPSFQCE